MADEPLVFPVRFELTTAEEQLDALEERAKKGITVPVRTSGTEGIAPSGAAPSAPPPPTAPPIAPPVAAYQSAIQQASNRGDIAAVELLRQQARSAGIENNLTFPTRLPEAPRVPPAPPPVSAIPTTHPPVAPTLPPTVAERPLPTAPIAPTPAPPPAPTLPPIAPIQTEIDAAIARGDMGRARDLAKYAATAGIAVKLPPEATAPPPIPPPAVRREPAPSNIALQAFGRPISGVPRDVLEYNAKQTGELGDVVRAELTRRTAPTAVPPPIALGKNAMQTAIDDAVRNGDLEKARSLAAFAAKGGTPVVLPPEATRVEQPQERAAQRLLRRVPEPLRESVERVAADRTETLGEPRLEAIRESIQIHKERGAETLAHAKAAAEESARRSRLRDEERDRAAKDEERFNRDRVRAERAERTGERLLSRVPEADRPVVLRDTEARVKAGAEGLDALRASVEAYRDDTREHREFISERTREQREALRATRVENRARLQLFQAEIAGLTPSAQRRRIEERLEAIRTPPPAPPLPPGAEGPPPPEPEPGPPPEPDDPRFSEYVALQRQANALRTRSGLFQQLGGRTGSRLFIGTLFGAAEVSKTLQQVRESALKASLAQTDIERAAIQVQGATAPGGLFGGTVALGLDLLGSATTIDSPSKLRETLIVEQARRVDLDRVRDTQFQLTQDRARVGTIGLSNYQSQLTQARIQQQQTNFEAQKQIFEIQGQLNEVNPRVSPIVRGLGSAAGVGIVNVGELLGLEEEGPRLSDPAVRSARRGVQRVLSDQQKAAKEERSRNEEEINRQHRIDLATMGIERDRLAGYAEGRSRRELDLAALRATGEIKEQESVRQYGAASPEAARVRELNKAQVDAATLDINRQRTLERIEAEGITRTAGFRARNQPIEAQLSGQFTEVAKSVAAADPENRFRTLIAGAASIGATVAEIYRGTQTQTRQLYGEAEQAQIATQTVQQVSAFRQQNLPVEAERARIQGERRAALQQIEQQRQQRVQDIGGGIAGFLLRPGVEIAALAQQAKVQAETGAQQSDFDRQRAQQGQFIDINLTGRARQVKALLDRAPTLAEAQGIVAQTQTEELQLRLDERPDKAEERRKIGLQQLALTRQDFLESFRGVQVSKDFAAALAFGPSNKYGEDPGKILQGIKDAQTELGKPTLAKEGQQQPASKADFKEIFDAAIDKLITGFNGAIAD